MVYYDDNINSTMGRMASRLPDYLTWH